MSPEHADTAQTNSAKRGRPRKYPVDTDKLLKQQERKLLRLQQQLEEQKRRLHQKETHSLENKPREECSYKDFYPDLDIRKPLTVTFKSPSPPETEKPNPLKSPILDDCKAASESKVTLKNTASIISRQPKLPIPSFRKESFKNIKNVTLSAFQRPENYYIRYTEPSEVQLFNTIEYDMDEQDKMWLLVLNTERKRENLGELNADLFENIMDQLEKEWFDLVKNLPKRISEETSFPEDSKCAICDDGECENSNAIVFCDGCNLAVHQDCYGVPYIPEGQWLCRKCMVSPDRPVSCIFCPTEGGAFKQTTTNQWGHLLCAIWIPEVILGNSVYMEPIDSIASVPKSRWKLTCYICRRRQGACIQCDNKHCFTAFHVTCARWARLYMKMKPPNSHSDDVALKAHCDKHTPKEYKEKVDVDKSIMAAQKWFLNTKNRKANKMPQRRYVDEELDVDEREHLVEDNSKKKKRLRQDSVTQLLSRSKAARAHQHHYSAGAPVAPNYIIRHLENLKCVRDSHLRKKPALIKVICKYWSLKRESKRGAPLLKRLHLEPWTASASQLKESEVETAQKASSLMSLRSDLEKVRILTEQVQKREKHKLERSRKQKAYLELILFPLEYIIAPTLRQISDLDKNNVFRYPVTEDIAPDYHTLIKEPISFSEISHNIESHLYRNFNEFEYDVSLIWNNCMLYNRSDTTYYKLAQRLKKASVDIIAKAKESYDALSVTPETGFLDVPLDSDIFKMGNEKPNALQETANSLGDSAKEKTSKENIVFKNLDKEGNPGPKTEDESIHLQNQEKEITSDKSSIDIPPHKSPTSTRTRVPSKRKASIKANNHVSKKNRTLVSLLQEIPDHLKTPNTHRSSSARRLTRSKTERSKRLLRSRATSRALPEKKKDSSVLKRKPTTEPDEQTLPEVSKKTVPKKLLYKDKEIVWARVPGFPAHPAEIVEAKKRKNVPDNVLASKVNDYVLVKFFSVSEMHTWGWIDKSDIELFGTMEQDIAMLAKAKKTRKSRRITEVKKGFRYACKLKNIDPLPLLDKVFQK